MPTEQERDEYSQHMDDISHRIFTAVDGEDHGEIALACCAIIAYSLQQLTPEEQATARPIIQEFFNKLVTLSNN
jgi:hypothetical protein